MSAGLPTRPPRRVCAVVVTYNRSALLRECLQRIEAQRHALSRILVIDNHSTDDTAQWLPQWQGTPVSGLRKDVVRLDRNTGGAGGFSAGLQQAHAGGDDLFWLMDDDTFPTPEALGELVTTIDVHPRVAFACSNVRWTDGSAHLMNVPGVVQLLPDGSPFNSLGEHFQINSCSFVSVLFRREAVAEVGLPYKEFFIWADDMEYTQRMIRAGWHGLYAPQSRVIHATPTNYNADVMSNAAASSAWKLRHGTRNELFLRRLRKGKGSYTVAMIKTVIKGWKVRRRNREGGAAISVEMWKGCWESLRFAPTIDPVSPPPQP